MDADGTQDGFDLDLIRAVRREVVDPGDRLGRRRRASSTSRPAVDAGADAVLAATVFHFGTLRIGDVKGALARRRAPRALSACWRAPRATDEARQAGECRDDVRRGFAGDRAGERQALPVRSALRPTPLRVPAPRRLLELHRAAPSCTRDGRRRVPRSRPRSATGSAHQVVAALDRGRELRPRPKRNSTSSTTGGHRHRGVAASQRCAVAPVSVRRRAPARRRRDEHPRHADRVHEAPRSSRSRAARGSQPGWARRRSSWWTTYSSVLASTSTGRSANGVEPGLADLLDEHAEVAGAQRAPSPGR